MHHARANEEHCRREDEQERGDFVAVHEVDDTRAAGEAKAGGKEEEGSDHGARRIGAPLIGRGVPAMGRPDYRDN